MERIRWTAALMCAAGLLMFGACVPEEAADVGDESNADVTAVADAPSDPTEVEAVEAEPVTFTATEFAFDGPTTFPGGMTTIEFVNNGEQQHSLIILGRADHTTEDVLAVVASENEPLPDWMTFPGGVGGIGPGESATAVMNLPAGEYTIISFESAEGEDEPDFAKGMVHDVTVSEPGPTAASAPDAAFRITMSEYAFAVDGDLASGRTTIEFVNDGQEPHEAYLMKLADGVTAEDFVMMMGAQGEAEEMDGADSADQEGAEATEDAEGDAATEPVEGTPEAEGDGTDEPAEEMAGPPVTSAGGAAPMGPRSSMFITQNLEAGRYALICFIPSSDGTPHFALGMLDEITIE